MVPWRSHVARVRALAGASGLLRCFRRDVRHAAGAPLVSAGSGEPRCRAAVADSDPALKQRVVSRGDITDLPVGMVSL